jgi:hypothetical protein
LISPTFIPFKPFFISFLFHIFRLDSLLDRWTCEHLLYIYTYVIYTLLDPYHFTVKTLYLGLPTTPDFCLSIAAPICHAASSFPCSEQLCLVPPPFPLPICRSVVFSLTARSPRELCLCFSYHPGLQYNRTLWTLICRSLVFSLPVSISVFRTVQNQYQYISTSSKQLDVSPFCYCSP